MNDILPLLLGAGGATIIAAIVNAVFNRRKLSAEATQIITQAAAGTVENIMKDNASLRLELGEVKAKMIELTAIVELSEQRERHFTITEERYRWHMQQWHSYCTRLANRMRAAGLEVEDPPPLWLDPVVGRAPRVAADANIEEI